MKLHILLLFHISSFPIRSLCQLLRSQETFLDRSNDESFFLLPSDITTPHSIKASRSQISGHPAYYAEITNATDHLHFIANGPECPLSKTSTFAKRYNCAYATNGGPFTNLRLGGCIGPTMSHGTWIHNGTDGESTIFGVTEDNHWMIGVWDTNRAIQWKARDVITGLDNAWLIQNGTLAHESKQSTSYAPRTAIGVTATGRLVLVQVDGCEHCPFENERKRGASLVELGSFMISQLGVSFGINLDGGGSATTVVDGNVVNRPTCLDYINAKCQRKVATVVCLGDERTYNPTEVYIQASH